MKFSPIGPRGRRVSLVQMELRASSGRRGAFVSDFLEDRGQHRRPASGRPPEYANRLAPRHLRFYSGRVARSVGWASL